MMMMRYRGDWKWDDEVIRGNTDWSHKAGRDE